MGCQYIYKDANGKPSAIYERALEKYGPEKAEEIYIRHMMSAIDTRFSKSAESIQARAKNIKLTKDEKYYEVGGKLMDRTTTVIERNTDDGYSQMEKVINAASGRETGLELGKTRQAKELIAMTLTREEQADSVREANIEKKIAAIPGLLEKVRTDVQTLWEAQQTEGTMFHAIASEVANQWELMYDQRLVAGIGPPTISDLHKAIDAAKVVVKPEIWNKPGTNFDRFSGLLDALMPVYNFILSEEQRISERIHLDTDLTIYSDKLKDPNSNAEGLAGSIDLLLTTANKKYTVICDYKTKDFHKLKDFSKAVKSTIQGPFAPGITNSPENRGRAQELIYATILSQEYGIQTTGTATFVVPMYFEESDTTLPDGQKQYQAHKVGKIQTPTANLIPGAKVTNTKPQIIPVGNAMAPILTFFTKGDLNKIYDEARKTGIAGVTEKWSGENAEGQPNATFSKDHRESFIKNKLKQKYTDKDTHKLSIKIFKNKPIVVEGMSDEEIAKLLGEKYDEFKRENNNIANDVIKVFESEHEVFPKTLLGKQNAVRLALSGITKETHTLELAQSWPELHGIGPDVLIATNRTTEAISLISLVTTEKHTITNFRHDGDKSRKNRRTSLLGNYKTDGELESNAMDLDLMTAPTTHDFLAMKLGLAAMYIHKKNPKNFAIDQMKVISMTSDTGVFQTPTTIEEEIAKLQQFEKYAGADFPAEYSELLRGIESDRNIGTTANHLEDLILAIENNTDPLGSLYGKPLKTKIVEVYKKHKAGDLVGFELKTLLGKYLTAVAYRLKSTMDEGRVKIDPRFIFVSKAFQEALLFQNEVKQYAKDRHSLAAINGAVSSGDENLIRFHVMYQEATGRIRASMDTFFKEHMTLVKKIQKKAGVDIVGDSDKAFANMFRNSDNPAERMMLKDEDDSSLSDLEKEYIRFFNKSVEEKLIEIMPVKYHEDIRNGRFWKKGTVPLMLKAPELMTAANFKSWGNLRDAVASKYKSLGKNIDKGKKSLFEFDFKTQFEDQATDDGPAHSDSRRRLLGIEDLNNPRPQNERIETNLAFILNLLNLEAAEKTNYSILLQSAVAAKTVLASKDDPRRTDMTKEMIDGWVDMTIFSRYEEEPLGNFMDPINTVSSTLLFSWSIRQAMIEFSTGTLQTAALLMSNSLQNAYAAFYARPENAGRFTMKTFVQAVSDWNKYDPKLEQMVWDHGMLVADADDMKTPEFKGANAFKQFKSSAGFWLNRAFFNTAITNTFLAQMYHLGINNAYVKKGDRWVYDETLDPRFFAYDPDNKIGTRPPSTDDETTRYSLWKAVRKTQGDEGMIDKTTGRMIVPMTANERAEIKNYATRTFGSFNKDANIHGEAYAIIRSMSRYKKWAYQKMSNYWTPTVKDNPMYGHWEMAVDEETGEKYHNWVGDDFQGIIQTVGFMLKEIASLRAKSAMGNLNQYQRENLSKLLADLLLWAMFVLLMLPILRDTTEVVNPETGEIKNIKGDFGKSALGDSSFKAAQNAAADLLFLTSMPNLTSSMIPAGSVMGGFGLNLGKAMGELLKPEGDPMREILLGIGRTGMGRSVNIATGGLLTTK